MISFKNPADIDNIFLKAKISEWLKSKFDIETDIEVAIREISCGVDSCPCITTEFKISAPFQKVLTLGKPLVFIRKWDIDNLVEKPIF